MKKFFRFLLYIPRICLPLHPQSREIAMIKKENGALVQLVRIHACHAWGHGFESRPHRNKYWKSMFYVISTRFFTSKNVKSGVFVLFKE